MTLLVNTKPEASVLGVFKHLNYTIWGALSEYVDNSVQSYLSNQEFFEKNLNQRCVNISIVCDNSAKKITIKDDAAGISLEDFPRAFRPASIPSNTRGLSEFGLGMKTASCWMAPVWSVKTSAINDPDTRTVEFDVDKIIESKIDEVEVKVEQNQSDEHYTLVELLLPYSMPIAGPTLKKIKDHLQDIYRIFIRDGVVKLSVNGEYLTYSQPEFLLAPQYNEPPGSSNISWRRQFEFLSTDGSNKKVYGFIGILQTMSKSNSGLTLFRRGRAIVGSGETLYRPSEIFGSPNSFKSRRLFGEIHLDDFQVTSQKDAFTWREFTDGEAQFIELLKDQFSKDKSFITQADNYRAGSLIDEFPIDKIDKLLEQQKKVFTEGFKQLVDDPSSLRISAIPSPPRQLPDATQASMHEFKVKYLGGVWHIKLELTRDTAITDWLTISDKRMVEKRSAVRYLGLSVAMKNPFMIQFLDADLSNLEPIFRLAIAIGMAEILAIEAGDVKASLIRKLINDLLNDSLAKYGLNNE
jgi:hypothetical protein